MTTLEEECPLSNLEKLPIEVIERISEYLSVTELNTCCACSVKMREIFSDDFIWKKFCDKSLVEYLKSTPCRVKPEFAFPPLQEDTLLSPIPNWRQSFMRENHLWNNWAQGKYVKEIIKNNKPGNQPYVKFHTFLSNDYIVALFDNRFEVLDVRQFPAVLVADVNCYGVGRSEFKIQFEHDLIICILCNLVQVFQLIPPTNECSLKLVFFLENNAKTECKTTNDVRREIERSNPIKTVQCIQHVGKVIVGVVSNQTVMHIWNIDTGDKIGKVNSLLSGFTITEILPTSGNVFVLTLMDKGRSNFYCCVYNLDAFKYLPFQEKLAPHCSLKVFKHFVAVYGQNVLKIFNFQSSHCVFENSSLACPSVFKNGFTFIDRSKNLQYFDTSLLNLYQLTSVNNITSFEVLSNKFIQLQHNGNYQFTIGRVNGANTATATIGLELYFSMCAYFFNKAHTRYIVREDYGRVMHFW